MSCSNGCNLSFGICMISVRYGTAHPESISMAEVCVDDAAATAISDTSVS